MKYLPRKPYFIGIGASKASLNCLSYCLKEHSEICINSKKEIFFFNKLYNYLKGIEYNKPLIKH